MLLLRLDTREQEEPAVVKSVKTENKQKLIIINTFYVEAFA